MIYLAMVLLFATGVAHSYLGERYILTRLFKRGNLPPLLGGTAFTEGTLRFVWHLTTVVWWGMAYLLWCIAGPGLDARQALLTIAATSAVSGLFPLWFTRGRHLSWVVFFAVAGLLFAAAQQSAS